MHAAAEQWRLFYCILTPIPAQLSKRLQDRKMSENKASDSSSEPSNLAGHGELKNKIMNSKHWMRLLLMVLMYTILFSLVQFITTISLLVQWVLVLFAGEPNARLRHFTKGLNRYTYEIMEFINFNSETRPFPLSDWPESSE
jgi:hypothetical protein